MVEYRRSWVTQLSVCLYLLSWSVHVDGGEGHVGTVREIGRLGSSNSPEKTVVVNWDSGNRTNYRVDYQDKYDLIVVDNAQIGKRKKTFEGLCDTLKEQFIRRIQLFVACPLSVQWKQLIKNTQSTCFRRR